METSTLCFMFLFVAVGLLMIGLSVPLIRCRVKPNCLYGFRTPKTLSSERVWYDANAYAGRMLLRTGIIFIAASVVLYFVFPAHFVTYNVACVVVLLSSLFVAVLLGFRHLRSL